MSIVTDLRRLSIALGGLLCGMASALYLLR
jgi:hypothetical protein